MKLSLIFEDNPISRCYIKIFQENSIKLDNLIILDGKFFLPRSLSLRQSFYQNNYWPLKFLKEKEYIFLTHQIEDYFNFPRNFCKNMYAFENINNVSKNRLFTNNKKINNSNTIKVIKNCGSNIFLNTGKQIYKNILDLDKKFIHIHPGFLPEVKGADGSLWHIKEHLNIGVSSFFMNKKIDEGQIIDREKLSLPNFLLKNYEDIDIKTLYRLWFSFFDPLLRGWHLKKLIKKNNINIMNNPSNETSKYFSYMKEHQLKETFEKVFKIKYKNLS